MIQAKGPRCTTLEGVGGGVMLAQRRSGNGFTQGRLAAGAQKYEPGALLQYDAAELFSTRRVHAR